MTTRSSSALVALVVGVALAIASPTARAEPSAADVESARALYVEGLELRDGGDLGQSLARFRAAHALAATPITALELGRAHMMIGELVEARDVLLSIERIPTSASESPKAAHARVEARALAEQLRPRIPALRVTFKPVPKGTPRITIDGAAIPQEALVVPRRLNPGKHAVVAELDGARATSEIALAEGEAKTLTLTLDGGGTRTDPVARAGPSGPERPPTAPGPGTLFYVGLGTAGVGVVVGTVTGVVALSKAGSLETACPDARCPRSAAGDLDTSRTMGTISTIAFAVAAAGAGVALVAWLARPTSGHASARAPTLTW
jgi:hypothetical protein